MEFSMPLYVLNNLLAYLAAILVSMSSRLFFSIICKTLKQNGHISHRHLYIQISLVELIWLILQGYNALCWHEQWLEGCDIKCYHYFNAKPWELRPDVYPDLKMWYQAVHELTHENSRKAHHLIV